MIRKVRIFLLGVREFRSAWTTHFDDDADVNAYDWGREIAHRLTFRRYDETH